MNKSTLVGAAMIAAAAIAVPLVAWSQSPAPQQQAEPEHPGQAGRMAHGWGRWARDASPQQHCVDWLARRAGFVANVGFRLDLTAEQKPLWDKLVAATQSAQDRQRQLCAALPASADDRGKETIIDRMQHRQQMMQARLQGLQQVQPAVQALYDKLTAEQKAILDHPFRRG